MEKEKLFDLIPEFNLIEDEHLRTKTVNVWTRAIDEGGWLIKELEDIPFTLLMDDCPFSLIEHTRGVVNVAIEVEEVFAKIYGSKIKINRDYLISGALLHDVGKLLEYEKKDGEIVKSKRGESLRHPFSGVAICKEESIPYEIMHIVAAHSKEGEAMKRSPEAVILHHADFTNFEVLH